MPDASSKLQSKIATDDLFGARTESSTQSQVQTGKKAERKKISMNDLFGSNRGPSGDSDTEDDFKSLLAKNKPQVEAETKELPLTKEVSKTSKPLPLHESVQNIPVPSQSQYDIVIDRLNKEIDELTSQVKKLKEEGKIEKETTVQEWKDKLNRVQFDSEKELERVKDMHNKAMTELETDRLISIERVKESLNKELEAVTNAHQQTRSYNEVITKVETAVDQLADLSNNVTKLNEHTVEQREQSLIAREGRVMQMEQRLERQFNEMAMEKEKVHSLLFKFDNISKEQHKLLEQEKWCLREEQNKLDAIKSSFREEQTAIAVALQRQKLQLENSKEKFLNEQHDILARVLREQEVVQREKSAFAVHRDRDVLRLNNEAAFLDDKLRQIEKAEELLRKSRRDYDRKERILHEMEHTLMDDCTVRQPPAKTIRQSWTGRSDTSSRQMIVTRDEGATSTVDNESVEEGGEPLRRSGSIRSVLRHHVQLLQQFISVDK